MIRAQSSPSCGMICERVTNRLGDPNPQVLQLECKARCMARRSGFFGGNLKLIAACSFRKADFNDSGALR